MRLLCVGDSSVLELSCTCGERVGWLVICAWRKDLIRNCLINVWLLNELLL